MTQGIKPDVWAKLNIEPEVLDVIKKIAIDEHLKIYQVVGKVFREHYSEYFKKK